MELTQTVGIKMDGHHYSVLACKSLHIAPLLYNIFLYMYGYAAEITA